MAARTFRLFLINQTPLKLTQVQLAVDHGEWTDPWYAPTEILSGKTVGWQTESDGIATGTQGSITFEIEDGSSFVSAPGQSDTGHRDRLYIFWDTPFEGLTTRDIQWRVLKDIPAEGAAFATQDYRDGPSSAYQMLSMLRPQYDGPGSPCPFPFDTSLGDSAASSDPNGLITDGWVAVVPGVFAFPLPDPAIPHVQVDIYVQVKPGVTITDDSNPSAPVFTSSPSDATSITPCSAGPHNAFQGMWGDDTNQGMASILVTIAPDAGPAAAPIHAASAAQHALHDQITEGARSARLDQTRAPVARPAASQTDVGSIAVNQTALQGGFLVTVADTASTRHIRLQEDHVMLSSALIPDYSGDVRSHPGVIGVRQPARGGVMPVHPSGAAANQVDARPPRATETPTQTGSAAGNGVARATMETVDTLALSPAISLHLYNLNDTATHQRIGYRVRYVRTAADGSLIEDVMLGESAPPPR